MLTDEQLDELEAYWSDMGLRLSSAAVGLALIAEVRRLRAQTLSDRERELAVEALLTHGTALAGDSFIGMQGYETGRAMLALAEKLGEK